MDLRRSFPLIITGDASPSGSYRLLRMESTPRLVNDLFPRERLKVNASADMSHCTPNARCTGTVSMRSLGSGGRRLDLLLERHRSLLDEWMLSYVDVDLLWLTWLLCESTGQWLQWGWPQTSDRHRHRNCCTQSLWHLS